jgi:hypothetical protein
MASAIDLIVRKFLQKHGHTWQMHLIQNWRTIVGNLHTRICLEKIQGDTLVVGVYDSHWMQELFLLNSMLLDTINAHFDKPYVKHVRLKLAKQNEKQKKKKQVITAPEKQQVVTMTKRHESALSAVKDEQLQEALYHFLQYCKT